MEEYIPSEQNNKVIQNKKGSEAVFQTGKVISLASAHGIHDTYSSFVAPLLPVLIERLSILKVQAGAFLIFQQMPSILQPVIGHLADGKNFKPLVLLAPAVTATAMSLFAISPSYWMAAILLIISGLASAVLHAVAPAIISRFSGQQLGRGMSYWTISGEIGVMIGPILIATVISVFSARVAPWLMVGGLAASAGLAYWLRDVEFHSSEIEPKSLQGSGKKILRIFIPLAGIMVARAMLRAAVEIYMPIYLTERGASLWLAGSSLTLLEAVGIIGILIAAKINEWKGPLSIFFASLIGSPLFLYLFLQTSGLVQIVFMVLLGIISLCVVPIGMAVVQENFPENRSFANGLYLAIIFVANSSAGVVMGSLADNLGTSTAFFWSVWICLAGVPFIFLLPKQAEEKGK